MVLTGYRPQGQLQFFALNPWILGVLRGASNGKQAAAAVKAPAAAAAMFGGGSGGGGGASASGGIVGGAAGGARAGLPVAGGGGGYLVTDRPLSQTQHPLALTANPAILQAAGVNRFLAGRAIGTAAAAAGAGNALFSRGAGALSAYEPGFGPDGMRRDTGPGADIRLGDMTNQQMLLVGGAILAGVLFLPKLLGGGRSAPRRRTLTESY